MNTQEGCRVNREDVVLQVPVVPRVQQAEQTMLLRPHEHLGVQQSVPLGGRYPVLQGLYERTVNAQTRTRKIHDVPMELAPLQRPHPPVWYGVHSIDSAEKAARGSFNIACNESRITAGRTRFARRSRTFFSCRRSKKE